MKQRNDSKKITYAEISGNLDRNFDALDPQRASDLSALARVREAKSTQMQREQTRLSAKLGSAHPRVTALSAKRAANESLVERLKVDAARAQAPSPSLDPDAWIVHGHVYGPDRSAQAERVVTLHDADDKQLVETQARTDGNGHFVLCVRRDTPKDPGTGPPPTPGATVDPSRGPALRMEPKASASSRQRVYLHVSDISGKTLHRDTRALTPALGQVDYREIVLTDDPCGPRGAGDSGKPGDSGGGKDGGTGSEPVKPYVGNPATRELHDTQKLTKRCKLDAIKPNKRTYFDSTEAAEKAGYDYCAYCFGKEKSKR